ncbi:MAG: M23 family metallopeptidase [Heliobacteriaceae bacterium]|nr:M23 family metallopeptidase [Heliobacteriaceae bacterium]
MFRGNDIFNSLLSRKSKKGSGEQLQAECGRRQRRKRTWRENLAGWYNLLPKPDFSFIRNKKAWLQERWAQGRLPAWADRWRHKGFIGGLVGMVALVLVVAVFALSPGGQAGQPDGLANSQGLPGEAAVRQACQVKIDGQPVFVLANREEAEQVVKEAVNFFSYGQLGDGMEVLAIETKQQVTYDDVEVSPDQIQAPATVKDLLINGKGEKVRYIVQQGDTLWGIAAKQGMNWEELRLANSQLVNENKLQIDQELFLNRPVHYLNVVSTYRITAEEDIPCPTKIEQDTNLRSGTVRVKREGAPGRKIATYVVSKENNIQFEEALTTEKVLKEPVPRIEVRGNDRYYVASRGSTGSSYSGGGSGALSWPTNGRRITSGFGYRGREYHPAIDIDVNTGDPIYAAADGVVVSAGWNGNYGKMVVINHGGIQTRYAHLSQINVGNGQTVSRGAKIGAGGATGRAYGSHLHFEVYDGGAKNPLGYLK